MVFRCKECDRGYPCQRELDTHMKKHTEKLSPKDKDVQCPICRKFYSTANSLKKHIQLHEKQNVTEDEQHVKFIAENFDMKCDFCDTVFTAFYDAKHHYKQFHGEDKGYLKCCNVKLTHLWMMRDHIQSHLNPESFKYDKLNINRLRQISAIFYLFCFLIFRCDICNRCYTTKPILVQHQKKHKSGKNTFVCDYCGKTVRHKDVLLRHLFSKHVTMESKHKCEFCDKK